MPRDYINEYRDPRLIRAISEQILRETTRSVNIMEICGGHTHTIMKFGISQLLPSEIKFIHGPGCPVCVMPKERIDQAIALANMQDAILVTLGDMIRVPGSASSLQEARANGADIRALYSPIDALKIALENPQKIVIFFAIGFETTAPMTAVLIDKVINGGVKNLLFHINHVLVPPPVNAIMEDGSKIDAFLGPSHVSVITGFDIFEPIAERYRTPIVVSGFEPSDVLESVLRIVRQFNSDRCEVENQYSRAVSRHGNEKAKNLINKYMTEREKFRWRGLGDIPKSALKLRDEYAAIDAEVVYADRLNNEPIDDHKLCICASILRGRALPTDCKVFGKGCNPKNPLGSCMVSSEGACAAYYRYARE
ncbi:hydrogenase expression/formation protein [Campylobacterota bacterium]|nr:hydrogenase expression/formation protein [Campylobacterota bacterium]